jgi:hypothetical protein
VLPINRDARQDLCKKRYRLAVRNITELRATQRDRNNLWEMRATGRYGQLTAEEASLRLKYALNRLTGNVTRQPHKLGNLQTECWKTIEHPPATNR